MLSRAAVAALAVAALAGCGSDEKERPEKRAAPPALPIDITTPPPASRDDVLGLDDARTARPKRKGPKPKRAGRTRTTRDSGADDPAPPPPAPGDSVLAVRQVVADTMAEFGFAGADVDVSGGGRVVAIAVRRSQACSRTAPTNDRLTDRIRNGLPEVRTVRVTVTGTGQSLAAYRRARCAPSAPAAPTPSPGGGTVYSKRGAGPFTTPTFTIAARTWTVTYRNDADFFEASVLKDGRPQPFVLSRSRPGSATETLRGPGRFQLRVTAGDSWSLSVRDGT
ncbi:MAG TPA: hypothetical protein VNB64_03050 [Solirubrobacteraceae bacterium]|nr:hypothetical protein [Solirubrobacteraceae bacterium]